MKALYGEGFQEPTPRQLYGGWTGSGSDPDLRPEMSRTFELSGTWSGSRHHLLAPANDFPFLEPALASLEVSQSPVQRGVLAAVYAQSLGVAGRVDDLRRLLPELQDIGLNEDVARLYVDWSLAERKLEPKLGSLRAGGDLSQLAIQVTFAACINLHGCCSGCGGAVCIQACGNIAINHSQPHAVG